MAARKRKPKKNETNRLSSMVWMIVTMFFGGGIGGYLNPDLPIIGPLIAELNLGSGSTGTSAQTQPVSNAPGTIGAGGSGALGNAPASNQPSPQKPNDRLLICSFNIQVFGASKLAKPDVMQVIVQILRQFDIVAIQEVRAKDDTILPTLVQMLNSNGSQYSHIIGPRLGRTVSTEQYAYVFDTTRVEHDPSSVGTVGDPRDLLHREPFVARFRPRTTSPQQAFTFWLVNIHTDPDEVATEVDALADVFQMMRTANPNEDDVILLGDLNASEKQLGRLGQIPGIQWAVSNTTTNTRQTKAYDNIIFHGQATSEYLGRWGVFDIARSFQLTTEQALMVSDHLPVWAEFNIWESTPQQFSERPETIRR